MGTALDVSIGLGAETTYGTEVAVTRFFEAAETFDKKLGLEQGSGLRPGKRVNRLNRNVVTKTEVAGDLSLDLTTRGLGYLINAVLGSVTNTLVPSSTPPVYQQVHTATLTDLLRSYTIQKGLPPLNGGSVVPITMLGCMADTLDLDVKGTGIVSGKIGWVGKDAKRDTPYAAPSYPVDAGLFTNVHASLSLGGTVTPPTLTALATGGTAVNNFRDFSLSLKNNLDSDGFNIGGAGKRSRANQLARLEITGKGTAEFESTTLLDAYWSQTELPLVLTLSHDVTIEPTLGLKSLIQVVLPSVRLKGDTPKSNGGAPITQSIEFEAFDNGIAAQPIYIVVRTLDTAP
jgi:hypothetical protein